MHVLIWINIILAKVFPTSFIQEIAVEKWPPHVIFEEHVSWLILDQAMGLNFLCNYETLVNRYIHR